MVFLTSTLLIRSRGPDEFWRKRKIFKLSAHFKNGRRNQYCQAIRAVHRSLQYCTKARELKKDDMKMLWESRTNAAALEHGLTFKIMNDSLSKCNIFLNRKSLANLAIWEPRTFKSLTSVAFAKAKQDGVKAVSHMKLPSNIVSKGLIE